MIIVLFILEGWHYKWTVFNSWGMYYTTASDGLYVAYVKNNAFFE